MKVDLKRFNSNYFNKGASVFKQLIWILFNAIFLKNPIMIFMPPKIFILKFFGAKIGKGLIIKPSVNIKFPWKLEIGNNVWIGEHVWIDNLDCVVIGNNVCISQGALLLTGNHDYKAVSFDYKNAPIIIEAGVWIGASSVVCPGVICKNHSILTVGSVATKTLDEYAIYQGNPALMIRKRFINNNQI